MVGVLLLVEVGHYRLNWMSHHTERLVWVLLLDEVLMLKFLHLESVLALLVKDRVLVLVVLLVLQVS